MHSINNWIQHEGSYQEGVQLYEQLGLNKTWLKTFQALGETEFTYNQLRKELSTYLAGVKVPTQVPAQVGSKQVVPPSDLPTAPQPILDAVALRKQLYALVNREHERLVAHVEEQPQFYGKLSGEIKLREMVKLMDKLFTNGAAVPFNLIAITANRHKNEGGEILDLREVYQAKYRPKFEAAAHSNFDRVPVNTTASGKFINPLENRYRRIFLPETSEIKNVDLVLITHFNWRRVIY
ncbi:hypothetical protein [Emticicia fontis]